MTKDENEKDKELDESDNGSSGNFVEITTNLTVNTEVYDDETINTNALLIKEIRQYASEIQCSDFHGKGTVEDYNVLFKAASQIANEAKQMELEVDVDGFKEFGEAADQLSALFSSFIVKLEKVNTVNDTKFLTEIASALGKIVNLSNVFGRFKETIIATSTLRVPKSLEYSKTVINNVLEEVSCAMGYISYFVDPTTTGPLPHAALNADDKQDIKVAVDAINSWSEQTNQSIYQNEDVISINQSNTDFKVKTEKLKRLTTLLRDKLKA
jgi:hypothetical protein